MNFAEELDHLTHPAVQAALLAAFGLLCLFWRRHYLGIGCLLVASTWMALCCMPVFALWLQHGLEDQYPAEPAAAYPEADAIVVLGGGAVPRSNHDWNDGDTDAEATRLGFGLQLFRSSRAGVILVSGTRHEAEQMANKLQQQGVPKNALRIEGASATTHENAVHSAIMLKRDHLQRILLVTSAMHMPRAAASFRRQDTMVIPTPAPGFNHDQPELSRSWRPRRAALDLTQRCLREYFGLWGYELRGWA